jgi:hypothetical protein
VACPLTAGWAGTLPDSRKPHTHGGHRQPVRRRAQHRLGRKIEAIRRRSVLLTRFTPFMTCMSPADRGAPQSTSSPRSLSFQLSESHHVHVGRARSCGLPLSEGSTWGCGAWRGRQLAGLGPSTWSSQAADSGQPSPHIRNETAFTDLMPTSALHPLRRPQDYADVCSPTLVGQGDRAQEVGIIRSA